MSPQQPRVQVMHPPLDGSGWGPWSCEAVEAADGPGLLVSRVFWLGGGLSVLLWAGMTLLALQWI
ncbi:MULTISPECIES: hypothetical protein [Ramlibacter]|uniref:Uncharacterized protein n=1 Tax=Ramlibacter pinisoli TaxID=2682844 RepID=A0A6N8ISZ0_9BURK|nr:MULTISPECIES: hypothetical protein [Ramlibacter]MBA2964877.1 hypothetical protein [Ramlibacter sp. CGMCC 1.13660]MVQ29842.1 hypothetical protein [Ramlibacter pinisoli]